MTHQFIHKNMRNILKNSCSEIQHICCSTSKHISITYLYLRDLGHLERNIWVAEHSNIFYRLRSGRKCIVNYSIISGFLRHSQMYKCYDYIKNGKLAEYKYNKTLLQNIGSFRTNTNNYWLIINSIYQNIIGPWDS